MKVAIVSDPISAYGGAERVLEQIFHIFPKADIYVLADYVPAGQRDFLQGRTLHTSFIQNLPGGERMFRKYLSLWPQAVEFFDLSEYDLIISSHHCVAHGVISSPTQLHLVYSHSPMRYAWDLHHRYLSDANLLHGVLGFMAQRALHKLRQWDVLASQRADVFIANSRFVAERIRKYYGRTADIVYPPVYIDQYPFQEKKENFYLAVGRLVAYKRFDLLVKAFTEMKTPRLIVAGAGPDAARLRAMAGPNVVLLGHVPESTLRWLMANAKAFLFGGVEDFGIAPVEAQAAGTPVICFGRGGLCETVRPLGTAEPTGLYFHEQTNLAIIEAVRTFERLGGEVSPWDCHKNASRFGVQTFRDRFKMKVEELVNGRVYSGSDGSDRLHAMPGGHLLNPGPFSAGHEEPSASSWSKLRALT